MSSITHQVYYTAACPECGGEAQWHGVSVGELVPLHVHSTQDYYDDHIIVTVRCRKCDAQDEKWTAVA